MFEIKEGAAIVNGEYLTTFSRGVIEPDTVLKVTAGTTGYKGTSGRNGGGRSYISIECKCGDFHLGSLADGSGIEIACCGDAGLNALLKALSFAYDVIDDQRREIDD